ncbi:MAG: uroporphyrinogen decarboxylase [Pseudomonadota bacterium]|nr:uroporphyrinogen decarboxylase [Pseudomonadota bacterium]
MIKSVFHTGAALDYSFQDSLLIRALNRQPVDRTPIWLMRQAGRYLPEYRAVRQQVKDFWELCQTPELACEVTLQPLRRYDLDASIVFSDILTIPKALGLDLVFEEKKGPVFSRIIDSPESIRNLQQEDVLERLDYVFKTVALCRQELPTHVPLFGFSGSPWTLACYMIEGQSSREFDKVFKMLYQAPQSMHALLKILSDVVSLYLIEQAKSGAQALMLFDTWGGVMPADAYQHFNLNYLTMITQNVKKTCPDIPVVIFGKGTGFWLPEIAKIGCDAISVDWTVDLGCARKLVNDTVALQGNLHPKVLLQSHDVIRKEALKVLDSFGHAPGHVFNLGHGITPDVHPDAVDVLIETVHGYHRMNA